MKYNNILLVASEEAQKQINLTYFLHDSITGIETTDFTHDNPDRSLKSMVRKSTRCEFLVTVGDWAENEVLTRLVSIARTMNLPVIHESNYKKYVDQLENN